MDVFLSVGMKRRVVAWLNTILGFIYVIPILPPSVQAAIITINQVIEALGGVAITQATASGTVSKHAILSAASAISFLTLLSFWIPGLGTLHPILLKLQLIVSAMAAGKTLKVDNNV